MGKHYKRKRNIPKEGYLGALWRMLPAVLMVGIVPLIVRQYRHETGLTQYGWFGTKEINYDFFLASKALVLTVLLLLMAGGTALRLWKEKKQIPFAKLFLPLLGYGVLAFLSACFSVNPDFSFGGSQDQFESIWVLLSYVAVVYYVFLYAREELELRVLADAMGFGATVIGILGMLQGFGLDFLSNKLVQRLITTDDFLRMIGGEITTVFSERQAVATLYNPNYLGVYGSFMVPFLTMMIFYEKSLWRRFWHMGNFVLMALAFLFSGSRAGLISVAVALLVAIVICFRGLFKYWYLTIPALNFAVVIVLLVNAYNDNMIFERLESAFTDPQKEIEEYVTEDGALIRKTGLTELYTAEDGIVFTYNEIRLKVYQYTDGKFYGFFAEQDNGNQIEMTMTEEDAVFKFEHPALEGVTVTMLMFDEWPGLTLTADGYWHFIYDFGKEKYQYLTVYEGADGKAVWKKSDMIMAESCMFENSLSLFSGRGYIWSRSIPLIKDHIFLGSGPDTFILEYPQNDYLMMNKMGFSYKFMSKPHSMYLQIGVQTGVLSLLCLLVFYMWYAIWCLRLYSFRRMSTFAECCGIAAFMGSIGYMISGISNDSMVVTAPVFWGMIGLGIAANTIVSKKRKELSVGQECVEEK